MDMQAIPMTRTELRSAITSHPRWTELRAQHGWKIDAMTMAQLRDVGVMLDIQGAATAGAATPASDDAAPRNLFGEQDKPAATATKAKAAVGLMTALEAVVSQMASQSVDRDAVVAIVRDEIKAAMADAPVTRIAVTRQDGTSHEVKGHKHPMLADLLTACAARDVNGYPLNVWISGPAGSGKTHAAHQVADAMGLAFYLQGAMSMSHELIGFVDAGGRYHDTPFVRAYRDGGVILLDELDAGDNSALLALNSALANGGMSLPTAEYVKRHKDTIVIGAANTFGLGATADYIGRAKIDAAFLSRFPVKLAWGYDEALERSICGNAAWAKRVQKARAKAQSLGLKVVIDPRHSIAGAALIAAGVAEDKAAGMTYLANLTPDQRRMMEG